MIIRIVVAPKGRRPDVYVIFNLEMKLEIKDGQTLGSEAFESIFCDPLIDEVVRKMPSGRFLEVMYHNGVIDPAQEAIIAACARVGIKIEAVKVGHRYYGRARLGVFVNKLVQVKFTKEPVLETLKPRGSRKGMAVFDLTKMSEAELLALSQERDLSLSLEQMQKLVELQRRDRAAVVTDVWLETFAARWSDHCCHTKWKSLGLFKILKDATARIKNSNLVSAFVDNAGGWKFFGGLVAAFKLETHCSPTQQEPYGGQLTKLGGVLRDIFDFGLGALPIGNLEMTVVGEFILKRYRWLKGQTLGAKVIARETIRAIADYGNPMGVPMLLARMFSHPAFGGKVFALGGTIGLTTGAAAKKGRALPGDFVVLVGGRTGNDGLHGATVSSGAITQHTDTGDRCHVQIGNPFVEQKMMPATIALRDEKCLRAKNDCGAAGLISAAGEMGETAGGVLLNLAWVPLKCAGLENWQIALSESQERCIHAVKPRKWRQAQAIYRKYGLEATIIGVITGNGRFQITHDEKLTRLFSGEPLSGEICLDVPFSYFNECPLPRIKIIEPPVKPREVVFPKINLGNVAAMAERVVGHFDVCNQARATTQYDSTVQGRTFQGPLYGRNYNIASMLAALKPVYGKSWGLTVSQSFSPWQFEVDPIQAAINAMLDAVITQVCAGVRLNDVCLADNFYTPSKDKHAYWYLIRQVKVLADLSVELGTPFITGKDSSSGSAVFDGRVINVPPSVCITAMGKIEDVRRLKPHKWQAPGNLIYTIGPQVLNISGSILSAALGIKGNRLNQIGYDYKKGRGYLECVGRLCRSEIVQSAVPINRGGIILRLFEGVEASGFGFQGQYCQALFPESFGTALVEVRPGDRARLEKDYASLEPRLIGRIAREKGLTVQGQKLPWNKLFNAWSTRFAKEVYQ